MAGMTSKQDLSQELLSHMMNRNESDIEKIISNIENTLNQFDEKLNDGFLYCLSTGKAITQETAAKLLRCMDTGKQQCEKFKNECFADPTRFEKLISRHKVPNFASDTLRTNLVCKDQKIQVLKETRDLFGRLLFLSVQHRIDLKAVFRFL